MKSIATKDATQVQLSAVVRAANLVEGGPFPGHVSGNGRLPKMPAAVTEADMLSGDPKRTLGWTCVCKAALSKATAVQAGERLTK